MRLILILGIVSLALGSISEATYSSDIDDFELEYSNSIYALLFYESSTIGSWWDKVSDTFDPRESD